MSAAAAAVLGAVFLLAAVAKLAGTGDWVLQAAGLGVPRPVALVVPYVEAAIGALLVVQLERRVVAVVAVAVLLSFTAAVGAQLARGRRPPCACFGAWSARPVGPATIARNLALVALGVLAAL